MEHVGVPGAASRPGTIVILNGAPRAGKSSIARAIQARFPGLWMNLGVDSYAAATPEHLLPGIGLRPGGELPDVAAIVPRLFAALYETIAAHSRLGINVVADVGHHSADDGHVVLRDCAGRLAGLPAILVGVLCPIDEIMRRRALVQPGRENRYLTGDPDDPPPPVLAWQREVHRPGLYDLEVDTSLAGPDACADRIASFLATGIPRPSALDRLAGAT